MRFYVSTVLVSLAGIAILSLGIYIKTLYGHYLNTLKEDFPILKEILIYILCLGCGLVLIGFIGQYGAYRPRDSVIKLYLILSGMSVLVLLYFGIFKMMNNPMRSAGAYHKVNNKILIFIKRYEDDLEMKQIIDFMHKHATCCGARGLTDWSSIPKSCCETHPRCTKHYQEGCTNKLRHNLLPKTLLLIETVTVIVMIIQVYSMAVGYNLDQNLKKAKNIKSEPGDDFETLAHTVD